MNFIPSFLGSNRDSATREIGAEGTTLLTSSEPDRADQLSCKFEADRRGQIRKSSSEESGDIQELKVLRCSRSDRECSDEDREQLTFESTSKGQSERVSTSDENRFEICKGSKLVSVPSLIVTDRDKVTRVNGECSNQEMNLNGVATKDNLLNIGSKGQNLDIPNSNNNKIKNKKHRKYKRNTNKIMNKLELTESSSIQLDSSSGRGTNLTRTISRSMLELDPRAMSDSRFKVSWKNLSLTHKASVFQTLIGKGKDTHVLKNLSGSFQSNQLVALIGPSGCGKTTLLQFISGSTKAHKECLRITGLDEPKVAFIGQGDCLLPNLTTEETLIYASRLQNSKPNFDHRKHVEPILKGLGLSECANRNVANLSGGQAKRVTIGQELLYPTNLLILDEITSGLDASTSYSIVKLLKQLACDTSYPMAIIMSIHQPSAKLFSVFDRVYVMSQGCCIYEGSCNIDDINGRLRRFDLECPKFHNIADYLIEIASDDLGPNAIQIKAQMVEYQRRLSESTDMSHDEQRYLPNKFNHLANLDIESLNESKASKNMLQLEDEQQQQQQQQQQLITDTRMSIQDHTFSDNKLSSYELQDRQRENDLISNHNDDNRDDNDDDNTNAANINDYNKVDSDDDSSQLRVAMLDSFEGQGWILYDAVERARNSRERPFFRQFLVHIQRSNLRVIRSHILTHLQLVTYLILALQLATFFGSDIGKLSGCPQLPMSFIGFLLSNESEDTVTSEMRRLQENLNLLLVSVMTCTFAALEITVITFPLEARTVKREWQNGKYRVSSYFMGRTLADFPFQFLCVSVFSTLIYTWTSQLGLFTWRFGIFLYIMLTVALIAQSVGFIFGAVFMDNLPAAVFMAPLCIFPSLLFSGFFARVGQIPEFYRLLSLGSHFRFAFDSLLVTLYGFGRCNCEQETLDKYHKSLNSQTDTMRSMLKTMMGASTCATNDIRPEDNMIEDTTGFSGNISSIIANEATTLSPFEIIGNSTDSLMSMKILASTTERPMKPFEDALVEKVFEHISKTNSSAVNNATAMEYLMNQFATRVTTMFNSRNNFGRPAPIQCQEFNSYLLSEFDVHENDLITGLLILTLIVIGSRILCNLILTITMRKRVD